MVVIAKKQIESDDMMNVEMWIGIRRKLPRILLAELSAFIASLKD